MLRGMQCERFIEKFAQGEVNLFEFLTITDARLKEIGIEFKFERNVILMGLHNFHNEPWSRKSLFAPMKLEEDLSDLDMMMMLANVLRQLVIVESQLVYMQRMGQQFNIRKAYKNFSTEFVDDFQGNVKELTKLMGKKKMSRPLMIKKKKSFIGSIVKFGAFGFIAFAVFKIVKKI